MDPSRQSPAPPEKDRYSYDEMMERLRDQRSSSGARRVRIESPDGSVEFKKRRRRSHQPKKDFLERIGRLRKTLLLTCIPVLLVLIGAYLLLNVRYQSDSFRSSLSQRASAVIGAKTEIAPLDIKGLGITSRRLFIEPGGNGLLQDAEFTSLNGRFTTGSLVSPDWHLTSLDAQHGKLRFHSPSKRLAARDAETTSSPLIGAGLGFSSKPSAFNIDKLHVALTNFVWTSGRKEFLFLEGATLTSKQVGARSILQIANAKLRLEGWPEFELESARASFDQSEIRIDDAILNHSFIGSIGGEATLSGGVDLSGSTPQAKFVCEFDTMPCLSLVEQAWKGKLEGDVRATLTFKMDLSEPESLEVSGPFEIWNGTFGNIDPTSQLATILAVPRMSRAEFDIIKGKITLADGARDVEIIEAKSPDLYVTGAYKIFPGGKLEGTLNVSISDEILDKFPGGKPEFFSPSSSSIESEVPMSSTTVQLSGTSRKPKENLFSRLDAAREKFEIESAAPPASAYPTMRRAPGAEEKSANDAAKKRAEKAFEKLIEP